MMLNLRHRPTESRRRYGLSFHHLAFQGWWISTISGIRGPVRNQHTTFSKIRRFLLSYFKGEIRVTSQPSVLEDECTELQQIWRNQRTTITIRFCYWQTYINNLSAKEIYSSPTPKNCRIRGPSQTLQSLLHIPDMLLTLKPKRLKCRLLFNPVKSVESWAKFPSQYFTAIIHAPDAD